MKNLIVLLSVAVLLVSCDKEKRECPGATEKSFNLSGFSKIKLGDANTISVTKGDVFSIKATGCTSDLDDLDLTVDANHFLDIKFRNYRSERYRVDFVVTLPTLVSLQLSGASKGTIGGFAGQNSVIRNILSGASECRMTGTAANASFDISGASKLVLAGTTASLYGTISGASRLEAYEVNATEVDIAVSGSSKAYVRPLDAIYADASGASTIYYKGNPTTKHFQTSGSSRIIHE